MTQKVRVLKSERDYDSAMERMSTLMSRDLKPGSDAEAEFDLLRLVISDFESKHVAKQTITPLQAIEFRMEQQKLTRKDLEPYIGSPSKVSEVMTGKRPLSIQMIRRLNKGLGIPASALIADSSDLQGDALEVDTDYEFEKFPLQEMRERGLFQGISVEADRLKDQAETLIREFLKKVFLAASQPALLRAPLHQSGGRTMDDYALLVWRACVVDKARRFAPRGSYRPGVITSGWLRDLAKLSRFDGGPKLAYEYLSKFGISLVIEPRFKKTYLDGAAMLDGSTPIVALTLRHDRLDNFWFALLHEVVHVQKHLAKKCMFIADNLDDKARAGQVAEEEADAGAREALIPSVLWESAKVRESHSAEDALELAHEAGVHPCIVAGRVRHATGNWRLLSSFISDAGSVKPYFVEQLQ